MINHQLAKNLLPYAQVKTDNEQSKALQRKLGMKIVEKPLFWLF
ncbi:hypothetical protein SDC9_108332 [bioreactor metagenome]|uniref:N-acetyltransferase domain-containing protein n=1 Tax=bioreactor metagenome TaxID=1076179 RepID=A0A645B7T5_9ZZZZ